MDKSIRDQCIELRKAVSTARAEMGKWAQEDMGLYACDTFQLTDSDEDVSFTYLENAVKSRGVDLQNVSIIPLDIYGDGPGITVATYTETSLAYWKGQLVIVESELQRFRNDRLTEAQDAERREYERLKKKFEG